jgi:phosphatidylserine/phosphatidylglycerophosphate/cardiolipin synthase-like enzyme
MVKWASDAGLEELLRQGCRIFLTRPPFDHSKIMVVDHSWVLLGSANWDSRSLALNFEFNMECYDFQLAEKVEAIMQEKKSTARKHSCQAAQQVLPPVFSLSLEQIHTFQQLNYQEGLKLVCIRNIPVSVRYFYL